MITIFISWDLCAKTSQWLAEWRLTNCTVQNEWRLAVYRTRKQSTNRTFLCENILHLSHMKHNNCYFIYHFNKFYCKRNILQLFVRNKTQNMHGSHCILNTARHIDTRPAEFGLPSMTSSNWLQYFRRFVLDAKFLSQVHCFPLLFHLTHFWILTPTFFTSLTA